MHAPLLAPICTGTKWHLFQEIPLSRVSSSSLHRSGAPLLSRFLPEPELRVTYSPASTTWQSSYMGQEVKVSQWSPS